MTKETSASIHDNQSIKANGIISEEINQNLKSYQADFLQRYQNFGSIKGKSKYFFSK